VIAVVGRMNAGKNAFVNAVLQQDMAVVGNTDTADDQVRRRVVGGAEVLSDHHHRLIPFDVSPGCAVRRVLFRCRLSAEAEARRAR